jgi:hypothetical protein
MPKRRHGLAFVRLSQSLVLALLVAGPHAAGARAAQKLKPEEVVARHLEAVGPAGARAAKCSRMIVGASRASFRGGVAGSADGIAVIASEGEKFLIGMRFALPEYPHEKVGYDGRDLTVSYLTQGTRSALGGFLLQHEAVFRRGLMGGALSCSWPLWGATDGGVKLIYSGEKKVAAQGRGPAGQPLLRRGEFPPRPHAVRARDHGQHRRGRGQLFEPERDALQDGGGVLGVRE